MQPLHVEDIYLQCLRFPILNIPLSNCLKIEKNNVYRLLPMPEYSTAERRLRTMQLLKEQGHASVSRLSQQFGVSEVTIRKDLRALEERSLLVRTHGGAVLIDHFKYDLPFEQQASKHGAEKMHIGQAAAACVVDNDTLILGSGSTTTQVARHLHDKKNLTITTNSIHVARELLNNLEVDLLMLGGEVHPTTASAVGPYAEHILQDYSFKKLFMGIDGYDIGHGFTTTNMMEARLNRIMIESAQQVIVVADSSKFGRRALSLICSVENIDVVITDNAIADDMVQHLKATGVDIQIV